MSQSLARDLIHLMHSTKHRQLVGGRACGREPSRGKAHVWYQCSGCSGSCHRVAIRPFRMWWHLATKVLASSQDYGA
jgi:hypothetical protein